MQDDPVDIKYLPDRIELQVGESARELRPVKTMNVTLYNWSPLLEEAVPGRFFKLTVRSCHLASRRCRHTCLYPLLTAPPLFSLLRAATTCVWAACSFSAPPATGPRCTCPPIPRAPSWRRSAASLVRGVVRGQCVARGCSRC